MRLCTNEPSPVTFATSMVNYVLSGGSKIDKTKILMTIGSLLKIESIAEWNILQYFRPVLSDNRS